MPSTTVEIKGKDKTSAAFKSVNNSVGKLKGGVIAITAAVASASAAFGLWFNRMRNEADRVGKVANQINITAESLQKLQFAAGQGGVSLGSFDKSLQKFSESIGKALQGAKGQAEAFKRLNVELKDTEGNTKKLDQIFLEVAHGFHVLGDSARSASIATKLFGSSGVNLLPMLKSGSESISKLGERVSNFGGIISSEAIPVTEKFNDNIDLISRKLNEKFAPVIKIANSLVDQFTEKERLATMTMQQMRDHLQEKIEKLAETVKQLGKLGGTQKTFLNLLNKFGIGLGANKEAIQKHINVLINSRNEIDKQILVHKEQFAVERKALEEKNKQIDANELLAESNQIVSDSIHEVNNAVSAQNNIFIGQIETIKELSEEELKRLDQRKVDHLEEMAMLDEFDKEYTKKVKERSKLDKKAAEDKKIKEAEALDSSLKTIETLASGVKNSSIEMFRLWQASAIANATISTLEAATKALTAGPFLGPILAGVIYGLGMANVAKIASTQYQPKKLGGDVMRANPYIVGEEGPELFTPGRTGTITPNHKLGNNVVVNIYDGTGQKIDEAMSNLKVEIIQRANEFGQFPSVESPFYTENVAA